MRSTTIDTPVGPFTIVGRGKAVLASGFTTDEAELTALIPRQTLEAGPTDDGGTDLQPAIDAARAYFDGDLAAIDAVEVEQHGAGAFLDHAWDVLRTVTAGERRDLPRVRRAGRSAGRDTGRGQCMRDEMPPRCSCRATGSYGPTAASVVTATASTSSAGCALTKASDDA